MILVIPALGRMTYEDYSESSVLGTSSLGSRVKSLSQNIKKKKRTGCVKGNMDHEAMEKGLY